jgi:hypothetical protein
VQCVQLAARWHWDQCYLCRLMWYIPHGVCSTDMALMLCLQIQANRAALQLTVSLCLLC